MLGIVAWECICGCKVKVMYEATGRTVVLCPKPPCKVTHMVGGTISQLWTDEGTSLWVPRDFVPFIVAHA